MKLYAVRSKKTNRYFRFVKYCEDGWGEYEDIITVKDNGDFYEDDLPSFVSSEIFERVHYEFKNHIIGELDIVEFELHKKEIHSG